MSRRIYDIRLAKGMTQQAVRVAGGPRRAAMASAELGLTKLHTAKLGTIARALKVPVASFFISDDEFEESLQWLSDARAEDATNVEQLRLHLMRILFRLSDADVARVRANFGS